MIIKIKRNDPRRLRALVIDELHKSAKYGHSYETGEMLQKKITSLSWLPQKEANLLATTLSSCSQETQEIFSEKVAVESSDDNIFRYALREIRDAEKHVADVVQNLLTSENQKSTSKYRSSWSADDFEAEASKISAQIPNFDTGVFYEERIKLYDNIFNENLYILSGIPGSGKSTEIVKIIKFMENAGETYLLLAPTGKAVVRLRNESLDAQTIHKFIKDNQGALYRVDNIIIDEMSMVGIEQFSTLLQCFAFKPNGVKRLILVGDECQLPPINCGKPFIDIINHLKFEGYEKNSIKLRSNCRQSTAGLLQNLTEVYAQERHLVGDVFNQLKDSRGTANVKMVTWHNKDDLRSKLKAELQLYQEPTGDFKPLFIDNNSKNSFDTYANHQILTPYNAGFFGTAGLNHYIQELLGLSNPGAIYPGDKIIVTQNKYTNNTLSLSNGTLGEMIKSKTYRFEGIDQEKRQSFDENEVALAYAISVHKAQGSGFRHVHLVIPDKQSLLSRELVYTAISRPREKLTLYVQKTNADGHELMEKALARSDVSRRRTALFSPIIVAVGDFEPNSKTTVRSKGEYIIFKTLESLAASLDFHFDYETKLQLSGYPEPIKPDFTIILKDGTTIYWEHLGMLQNQRCVKNWQSKLALYTNNDLAKSLVTTDDLDGISHERCCAVISDIANGRKNGVDNSFSKCHYSLRSKL
jgi:hypothetical protein